MDISTERFFGLIAVLMAASWAAYGIEAIQPVQPVVRRGLQLAIMAATAAWALRTLQAL